MYITQESVSLRYMVSEVYGIRGIWPLLSEHLAESGGRQVGMRGIGSECVKTDSYQRICHRHIAVFLCAIRTLSHTYTHTHTYTHRHIALGTSPYNKSSENPKSTSNQSFSSS